MGLTIHYSLKARGSDALAREIINGLHQTAKDLPFKELGEMVELSGEECDFTKREKDDPLRWLLIQARLSVELKGARHFGQEPRHKSYVDMAPVRIIAFTAWPGQGCEQSNFGLCEYPAVVETTTGPLRTRVSGWHWSSFCKTQYASNPNCGGLPNFLHCHLSVIAMLDKAQELGCLECVNDEGGFWTKRDLPALAQEVGSWNEMLAAFGGKLKDLLGDDSLRLQSTIGQYPDFETLEAVGQNKLPPGLETLAKLIRRVRRLTRPEGARGKARTERSW